MRIAEEEAAQHGVVETCKALGLSRATYYRFRKKKPGLARRASPRKLSAEEERAILSYLTSERFVDSSVSEDHATLFDEGLYPGSIRTMYRYLEKHKAVKEHRNQRRHCGHNTHKRLIFSLY
jgi:putative transposase